MPDPSSRRRFVVACIGLPLLPLLPAFALAEDTHPAIARIRAFYDALLEVMKDADRLGVRGRYERLAPVIQRTFDLPAMTRIAVGQDWNSIPPDQQAMLVDAFSRMTIATYASRFDGYSGERFEVEPATETRNTGRIVRTRLVPSTGVPIRLDYLMRGSGDDWKVVDVYLVGAISELATRRSEFLAILRSGGAPGLVEQLREQADRSLGKQSAPK
jgi:phospholipid transport system substrate-binding protein